MSRSGTAANLVCGVPALLRVGLAREVDRRVLNSMYGNFASSRVA
jgi:hypothetical protein